MTETGDLHVRAPRRHFFFREMLHTQPALRFLEEQVTHARLRGPPETPSDDFRQRRDGCGPRGGGGKNEVKSFHSASSFCPTSRVTRRTLTTRQKSARQPRHSSRCWPPGPSVQLFDRRFARLPEVIPPPAPHLPTSAPRASSCRRDCSKDSRCRPTAGSSRLWACRRCGR